MVVMAVVVLVVTKLLVWDAAIIVKVVVVKVLVIGVLIADVIMIVLKLALAALYSVYVPFDLAVDLSMGALAGVMLGVLPTIGIEVLTDVNANAFTVVKTTLDFPLSEEFSL